MPTNGLGGLAYRDFAGFSHRIAQEHIGFVPSPANLEIVWLVEEERIDVVNFGAASASQQVRSTCGFSTPPRQDKR